MAPIQKSLRNRCWFPAKVYAVSWDYSLDRLRCAFSGFLRLCVTARGMPDGEGGGGDEGEGKAIGGVGGRRREEKDGYGVGGKEAGLV